MSVIYTPKLSPVQLEKLRRLVNLCREAEGISLSCPEDGDGYWILEEDGGEFLSVLAACKTGENEWECCGFTRPDCRRKGYFSQILSLVCGENGAFAQSDLYFPCDGKSQDALRTLEHMEAQPVSAEYMMEYDLTQAPPVSGKNDGLTLALSEPDEDAVFRASASLPGASSAACCMLSARGDTVYLYGLEVSQALRRRGIGTAFLAALLPVLKARGFRTLKLQVSGENDAALRLYKKTGFLITETLSYYLY
jgi:ribosomal protein S18 acetylase RimI-like enzyme